MTSREKKNMLRLLIGVIVLTLCVGMATPVQAASSKNAKAHKAYEKQIKKDQKKYCPNGHLKYVHKDLNGDGIDELITLPGLGYGSELLYTYKNKKVKRVAGFGHYWSITKYYPKKKVLLCEGDYGGVSGQIYYRFKGTKLITKASLEGTYDMESGQTTYTYYVNGKKTTKQKYMSYIKKLTKGTKAKSLTKVKWKTY